MPTSKKPRKKHNPRATWQIDPVNTAKLGATKMTEHDIMLRLLTIKPSFEALVAGNAKTPDWKTVLDVHNFIAVLRKRPGALDPASAKVFMADVRHAFDEIAYRRATQGTTALRLDERDLIWKLFDAYEDCLGTFPVRVIEQVEQEVLRRITRRENVNNVFEVAR